MARTSIEDGVVKGKIQVVKPQTAIPFAQNPPVQNTWYTVFDKSLVNDIEFYLLRFKQTNTETDAKDIEIRMIIDGVTFTLGSFSFVHDIFYQISVNKTIFNAMAIDIAGTGYWGTEHFVGKDQAGATIVYTTGNLRLPNAIMQIRMTSAIGTAQTLVGLVAYGIGDTT